MAGAFSGAASAALKCGLLELTTPDSRPSGATSSKGVKVGPSKGAAAELSGLGHALTNSLTKSSRVILHHRTIHIERPKLVGGKRL